MFHKKLKAELPAFPLVGIYPEKKKKKHNSKGYMYPSVDSSTIYNSQGIEAT